MPLKVQIHKLGKQFTKINKLIGEFHRRNSFFINTKILLDFSLKHLGKVKNKEKPWDWNIYINPFNCHNEDDEYLKGHPADCGFVSTAIHEFGHLLNYKLNLISKYKATEFKQKHLYLTDQAKENYDEELADMISLFIINPYCLKIISQEKFDWLSSEITSPSACTKRKFKTFYNKWKVEVQKEFSKKYKI